MDSFRDEKGKYWTVCHECEYGGNGRLKNCNVGKHITKNTLNRGCWGGDPIQEVKDGIERRKD